MRTTRAAAADRNGDDDDRKPPARPKRRGATTATTRKKPPASSRRKKQKVAVATADLPFLSDNIFDIIISMLLPREIIALCSTSKLFLPMVTIERAIRAAVVAEGSGQLYSAKVMKILNKNEDVPTPMESFIKILTTQGNKALMFPSPLRLLRLLCGKSCERCFQPCQIVVSLGLHICDTCLLVHGLIREVEFKRKYRPSPIEFMGRHYGAERQSVIPIYKPSCMKTAIYSIGMSQSWPYYDRFGERCGAYATLVEVEQLSFQNKTLEDHALALADLPGIPTDDTVMQWKEAYEGCMAELQEQLKASRKAAVEAIRQNEQEKRQKMLAAIERVARGLPDGYEQLQRRMLNEDNWCFRNRIFPQYHGSSTVESIMLPILRASVRKTKTLSDKMILEAIEAIQERMRKDNVW